VSICLSFVVAKQRLGKHVTAVTNTHATMEELLDAVRILSRESRRLVLPRIFVAASLHVLSDPLSVSVCVGLKQVTFTVGPLKMTPKARNM
jgi:hypothetical protein